MTDARLRTVLDRNAGELGLAMSSRAWTAAIVLAGAIAEVALYFLLSQRLTDATNAASAIMARNPKRKIQGPIGTWKLWAYIDVADEMNCLQGTSAIAHGVLRDFRNMVHPLVQIRDRLEPTANVAEGSVVHLRAVIADVTEFRHRSNPR